MIYLLATVILLGAVFIALISNIQATTKWLSEQIEKRKTIWIMPNTSASALEIQTMITPKWQAMCNVGVVILWIFILSFGFYIKWWVAGVALIALFFGINLVIAVVLPRRLSYWIKWVSIGIQNRISDYRKANDFDRASSLLDFIPILAEYEKIAEVESVDIRKI